MHSSTRLLYGQTSIDLDHTQASLLSSHASTLCRRRRTAVHTVYGHVGGSPARSAVHLTIGHGIAFALLPIMHDDEGALDDEFYGLEARSR
jgi:hypothetical protein